MTFSQTKTLNLLPAVVVAVVISFSACKNYDTVDDVKVTPPTPTTAPMNNSVSNVDSVGMMNGSTSGGSAAITKAGKRLSVLVCEKVIVSICVKRNNIFKCHA